jgi:hypothetical protein
MLREPTPEVPNPGSLTFLGFMFFIVSKSKRKN